LLKKVIHASVVELCVWCTNQKYALNYTCITSVTLNITYSIKLFIQKICGFHYEWQTRFEYPLGVITPWLSVVIVYAGGGPVHVNPFVTVAPLSFVFAALACCKNIPAPIDDVIIVKAAVIATIASTIRVFILYINLP
jgi:hypothetical protein